MVYHVPFNFCNELLSTFKLASVLEETNIHETYRTAAQTVHFDNGASMRNSTGHVIKPKVMQKPGDCLPNNVSNKTTTADYRAQNIRDDSDRDGF